MQCEDIMKIDVECVSPDDTAQDAASKMRDYNIGFLPVCDESKRVLGTLTDRDIAMRAVAEGLPTTTPVEEIMSPEVVACRPADDLQMAMDLMARHQKSRIVCIDRDGRLCGVISLSDIAQRAGSEATETLRQVSEREAHA